MEYKGLILSFLSLIVFAVILLCNYILNRRAKLQRFKEQAILSSTIARLHHDASLELKFYGFTKMARILMQDVRESVSNCPVCKDNEGTLLIEAEKILVAAYNKEEPELESEAHHALLRTLSQISGDLK